ncbi:MAG: hypothetical protein JXC36_00385 [Candidatus Atribacteria bacterium]|nr:hypothetical protein [Candidatus Atribacteria bacterium]
MESFINQIRIYLTQFKELLLLLGVIIFIWGLVAFIIKVWIRKPEKLSDSESDNEGGE